MPPTPAVLPPVIETFRKAVATCARTQLENDNAAADWARCLTHLQENGQGGPEYPHSDKIEAEAQRQERRLKEVAALVITTAQRALDWAAAQTLDCEPFRRYLKTLHAADYHDIERVLARYQEAAELAALQAEVTTDATIMPSVAADVVPAVEVSPLRLWPKRRPARLPSPLVTPLWILAAFRFNGEERSAI